MLTSVVAWSCEEIVGHFDKYAWLQNILQVLCAELLLLSFCWRLSAICISNVTVVLFWVFFAIAMKIFFVSFTDTWRSSYVNSSCWISAVLQTTAGSPLSGFHSVVLEHLHEFLRQRSGEKVDCFIFLNFQLSWWSLIWCIYCFKRAPCSLSVEYLRCSVSISLYLVISLSPNRIFVSLRHWNNACIAVATGYEFLYA